MRALHLADAITCLNGTSSPLLFLPSQLLPREITPTNAHVSYPTRRDQKLTAPGLCGVLSIFTSLRYCLGDPTDTSLLYLALAFLPFGLFFDFMDGRVARWRRKSSLMGQELDSLADLVSSSYDPPTLPPHPVFLSPPQGIEEVDAGKQD